MKRVTRGILTAAIAVTALSAPATAMASTAPAGHVVAISAAPAHASRATVAYQWALRQKGKHYRWGGTGPSSFDCSGLVMKAYAAAGIALPRTTYGMLSSRKLHRVTHPVAGDLAFFGSGHVELYAYGHVTFGAHSSSHPIIGFRAWSSGWRPTAFYRV